MSSMKNYKNEEVLRKLYLEKKLSIRNIAKNFNVDPQVIWYFAKKFKIPLRQSRGKSKEKFKISKTDLENLYLKKKLTAKEIANKFGIKSHKTVLLKLIKHGISRRTKSEVSTKYPKKPFSADLKEKAYLLGLRIGDLWATWHRKLIQVETVSTRPEQYKMMKDVFGKYSVVQSYPKKDRLKKWTKRIYVLLHHSFEFLLEKPNYIPEWILQNNEYFFAFLAGYIDAEGSWIITPNGKDAISFQFSIKSEDQLILQQLADKLNQLGFTAHLYLAREKGKKTNIGEYLKDLYSLAIYRKDNIIRLIKRILPLSHHEEKVKKMKLILDIIKHKKMERNKRQFKSF